MRIRPRHAICYGINPLTIAELNFVIPTDHCGVVRAAFNVPLSAINLSHAADFTVEITHLVLRPLPLIQPTQLLVYLLVRCRGCLDAT